MLSIQYTDARLWYKSVLLNYRSVSPWNSLAFVPDPHEHANHLRPALGTTLLAFILCQPFILNTWQPPLRSNNLKSNALEIVFYPFDIKPSLLRDAFTVDEHVMNVLHLNDWWQIEGIQIKRLIKTHLLFFFFVIILLVKAQFLLVMFIQLGPSVVSLRFWSGVWVCFTSRSKLNLIRQSIEFELMNHAQGLHVLISTNQITGHRTLGPRYFNICIYAPEISSLGHILGHSRALVPKGTENAY